MENDISNATKGSLKKQTPPLASLKLRLNTIKNSKNSLARIIRLYAQGQIETDTFKALVYGFSYYLNFLKQTDIVQKLDDLEEKVKGTRLSTEYEIIGVAAEKANK